MSPDPYFLNSDLLSWNKPIYEPVGGEAVETPSHGGEPVETPSQKRVSFPSCSLSPTMRQLFAERCGDVMQEEDVEALRAAKAVLEHPGWPLALPKSPGSPSSYLIARCQNRLKSNSGCHYRSAQDGPDGGTPHHAK